MICSDPNAVCDPNNRPISERKCELPPDIKCGKWIFSQWSQCNRSCGEAIRTRKVECYGGTICNTLLKPHDSEICLNNPPCIEDNSELENDSIIADLIISLNKKTPKRLSVRDILRNKNEDVFNEELDSNDFNSINYSTEYVPNESFISNNTEIDENSILFGKEYYIEDDYGSILVNDTMDYEWQVGAFSTVSLYIEKSLFLIFL